MRWTEGTWTVLICGPNWREITTRATAGRLCCCARDSTEAEEVLQSVYLKVLDGKAQYGGRTTFKTWLFAVIRLTAAEALAGVDCCIGCCCCIIARGVSPVEQPDEIVNRSQQGVLFQEALEALPRRQRGGDRLCN